MPVYNGEDFIVKSLPPLIEMQRRGEVREVVMVDDSSTDASPQIAAQLGATVIPSGGRVGPGAARNKAARLFAGEILWFVDADVVVHDDAVGYLKEGFVSKEVVAVFGSYDDRPAAQNFLSQYKNLVHHFYHHRGRTGSSSFWAGCGAIRRQAFLEMGGFDVEKYKRPSIEDIELGYRLREAGGGIVLIPEFKSTHLKEWRFANLIHTELANRAVPWSRLILEQTGMVNDLNTSQDERLRAGLAGIFFLVLLVVITGLLPWWTAIVFAGGLALANRNLLSLFYRKNGLIFAIWGLCFHQLYYLYSSCAFAYSWLKFRLRRIS